MEITKKEIGLALALLALLGWNAYTWYKQDNTARVAKPQWETGKPVSKATVTVNCPNGGLVVIDPKDWQFPKGPEDKPKEVVKWKWKEKIVEKIVTKEVEKKIEVVKKEFPDWFDPNNTALLADTKIPAWKGETYVVSTLDLTTGKGDIKYKQLPRDLWGFENEARVALGYMLIGTDAGKFMLSGQYTPIRMGSWYLNGIAQIVGDRTNAGVSVEYRW